MVRLSFKFLILGVLVGCLLFFYRSQSVSQVKELRVIAVEQPGAPVRIFPTFVDTADSLRPRYGYSVTNTTDKTIVAYAVQEAVRLDPGTPIVTTTLTHLPAKSLLLGPHDSRQEESGLGRRYREAPSEVDLSVDFVEFTDGTRWGADNGRSSERLDGERAGAQAAIKLYRKVLNDQGIDGLLKKLSDENVVEPEAVGKSGNWLEGFKTGVGIMKRRLNAANSKGKEAVRQELAKPYDATEGRLEPW